LLLEATEPGVWSGVPPAEVPAKVGWLTGVPIDGVRIGPPKMDDGPDAGVVDMVVIGRGLRRIDWVSGFVQQ
jgi:hypothetical protein